MAVETLEIAGEEGHDVKEIAVVYLDGNVTARDDGVAISELYQSKNDIREIIRTAPKVESSRNT